MTDPYAAPVHDDIPAHQDNHPQAAISSEDKTLALLAHLSVFLAGFIGPLVIWLVKKDDSAYVAYHAKEALNFQLSIFIYIIISVILLFVFIGILLLPVVGIFSLVVTIIAAVKANEGVYYRCPLCIRFF